MTGCCEKGNELGFCKMVMIVSLAENFSDIKNNCAPRSYLICLLFS